MMTGSDRAAATGTALPARITVQRKVEWSDTDGTGHHHFTAVLRWVEQAETVLHERLGIADTTLGNCPRVNLNLNFTRPIYFREVVDVNLVVAHVGTSSVGYDFELRLHDEVAAEGRVVAVFTDAAGSSTPWPPGVRRALLEAGTVDSEVYAAISDSRNDGRTAQDLIAGQ